jgi:CRISPR-associated protein Csm5
MSKFNYQRFEAHVLTLTPLHIGTGRELMQDYDYAVHNGQTWRLNETALLEAQNADDPAVLKRLMEIPPAQLLRRPEDFKAGSPYFRYFIRGAPRSQKAGSILREQIKTVDDRPYLPGSSLKGALRTALAWHGWAALNLRPDQRLIERGRFAARTLEKKIFGLEPNYDLLRALQVGDSDSLAPDCLMLANVAVWPAGRKSIPVEVEAVKRETRFRLPVKVDGQLFSDWARENRRDFRLGGARDWLEKLAALVRAHQAERIRALRRWHEERAGGTDIVTFYRDLEKLALKDNQFVLQLGWGGGWDSKTFGLRLSADAKFMDWLIREHRLSRARNRKSGDPFPATRRAAMRRLSGPGGQVQETPALPMGWVLVELKEA